MCGQPSERPTNKAREEHMVLLQTSPPYYRAGREGDLLTYHLPNWSPMLGRGHNPLGQPMKAQPRRPRQGSKIPTYLAASRYPATKLSSHSAIQPTKHQGIQLSLGLPGCWQEVCSRRKGENRTHQCSRSSRKNREGKNS